MYGILTSLNVLTILLVGCYWRELLIQEEKEIKHFLQYTKSSVQKAGKSLLIDGLIRTDGQRYKECMDIISKWRTCHIFVMNNVSNALSELSVKVDCDAIVVSRLKRIPSIITKLELNPKMNLDRMQDIAGCRAIVKSPKLASKIRRQLKLVYQLKETNYIDDPEKTGGTGYRGIHLIGKHLSEMDGKPYQVEIQVRTKLQHAWATSVEIVDLFTKQTLKSNIGKQDWKDFFKYAGDEFAKKEGTPTIFENSSALLAKSISKLNIYKRFEAFRVTLSFIDKNVSVQDHAYCLIQIDITKNKGDVFLFSEGEAEEATNQYLKAEKVSVDNPTIVSAMVSVASASNLKEAYPNYFADSTLFVETLMEVEGKRKQSLPGPIVSMVSSWLRKAGF